MTRLLDIVVPILVQVMVANIRCEEIAADQLEALLGDQTWEVLQTEAAAGLVSDFGSRASALLHSCLVGASPSTSLVSRHTLRQGSGNPKTSAGKTDGRYLMWPEDFAVTRPPGQATIGSALLFAGQRYHSYSDVI